MPSRRFGRALAAMLILSVAGTGRTLHAQSRETLETKVTAAGDQIILHWGKKHPWDADLAQGVFLLAEYRADDGGTYLDCLNLASAVSGPRTPSRAPGYGCQGLAGTPSSNREDREIRFHLPETVTRSPGGSICLYFRLPNQRILPIRKAGNRETSRFRYADWETQAKSRVKLYELTVQTRTLRHNVEATTKAVADQDSTNARKGWNSPAACGGIQAPDLGKERADRPIAEPADQEQVARRVCVMRVWNADSLFATEPFENRIRARLVEPPTVLDRLVTILRSTKGADKIDLSTRVTQAQQYARDWGRWAPRVREYKESVQKSGYQQPHFGDFADYIILQSMTGAVGQFLSDSLKAKGSLDPQDLAGYVGGTLESYSRCVSDGQAQLATAYRAITELRSRSPQLAAKVRQELVQACNQGVTKLAALRDTLTAMQGRLAQAEKTLAEATAGSTPLANRSRELNDEACTP